MIFRSLPILFLLAFCLAIFGCKPRPYSDVAQDLGLKRKACIVNDETVTIAAPHYTVQITRGKRPAHLNGMLYYLHKPAELMTLSAADLTLFKQLFELPPLPVKSVILDPGHGGKDVGCQSGKTNEKQITLAIANQTKAFLESNGIKVYMTRDKDSTTLTLDDRINFAKSHPADLYISIHVNSAANPEAKGVETYTIPALGCDGTNQGSTPRDSVEGQAHLPRATQLALAIQKTLSVMPNAPADRGIKHAYFKVLRGVPMPSVLVEAGFITHPEDRARLTEPRHVSNIAASLCQAILSLNK